MKAVLTMLMVSATILAGCQTVTVQSRFDGEWVSKDGFIATFRDGRFTTRLGSTGEIVVFDGRYARSGRALNLNWTSVAANEGRTAVCTFQASNRLSCVPSRGQPFTMTRT